MDRGEERRGVRVRTWRKGERERKSRMMIEEKREGVVVKGKRKECEKGEMEWRES